MAQQPSESVLYTHSRAVHFTPSESAAAEYCSKIAAVFKQLWELVQISDLSTAKFLQMIQNYKKTTSKQKNAPLGPFSFFWLSDKSNQVKADGLGKQRLTAFCTVGGENATLFTMPLFINWPKMNETRAYCWVNFLAIS